MPLITRRHSRQQKMPLPAADHPLFTLIRKEKSGNPKVAAIM